MADPVPPQPNIELEEALDKLATREEELKKSETQIKILEEKIIELEESNKELKEDSLKTPKEQEESNSKRSKLMVDLFINCQAILKALVEKNPDVVEKELSTRTELKKRKEEEKIDLSLIIAGKNMRKLFKKQIEEYYSMEIKKPINESMLLGESPMDNSTISNVTNAVENDMCTVNEKNIERIMHELTEIQLENKKPVYKALGILTSSPLFKNFLQDQEAEDFLSSLGNRLPIISTKGGSVFEKNVVKLAINPSSHPNPIDIRETKSETESLVRVVNLQIQSEKYVHETQEQSTRMKLKEDKLIENTLIYEQRLEEIKNEVLSLAEGIREDKSVISRLEHVVQLMKEMKDTVQHILKQRTRTEKTTEGITEIGNEETNEAGLHKDSHVKGGDSHKNEHEKSGLRKNKTPTIEKEESVTISSQTTTVKGTKADIEKKEKELTEAGYVKTVDAAGNIEWDKNTDKVKVEIVDGDGEENADDGEGEGEEPPANSVEENPNIKVATPKENKPDIREVENAMKSPVINVGLDYAEVEKLTSEITASELKLKETIEWIVSQKVDVQKITEIIDFCKVSTKTTVEEISLLINQKRLVDEQMEMIERSSRIIQTLAFSLKRFDSASYESEHIDPSIAVTLYPDELEQLLKNLKTSVLESNKSETVLRIKEILITILVIPGDIIFSNEAIDICEQAIKNLSPSKKRIDEPEHQHDRILKSLQLYLGTLPKKGNPLDEDICRALTTMRHLIDERVKPEAQLTSDKRLQPDESSTNEDKGTILSIGDLEEDSSKKTIQEYLQSLELYLTSIEGSGISLDVELKRAITIMKASINKRINSEPVQGDSSIETQSVVSLTPEELEEIVIRTQNSQRPVNSLQFLKRFEQLLTSLSEKNLEGPAAKCVEDIRTVVYKQIDRRVKERSQVLLEPVEKSTQEGHQSKHDSSSNGPEIPRIDSSVANRTEEHGKHSIEEDEDTLREELIEIIKSLKSPHLLSETVSIARERITALGSGLPGKIVQKIIDTTELKDIDEEGKKTFLESLIALVLKIDPNFTYGSEKIVPEVVPVQEHPSTSNIKEPMTNPEEVKEEAMSQPPTELEVTTVAELISSIRRRMKKFESNPEEHQELVTGIRSILSELSPVDIQQEKLNIFDRQGSEKIVPEVVPVQEHPPASPSEETFTKPEEVTPSVPDETLQSLKERIISMIGSISDQTEKEDDIDILISKLKKLSHRHIEHEPVKTEEQSTNTEPEISLTPVQIQPDEWMRSLDDYLENTIRKNDELPQHVDLLSKLSVTIKNVLQSLQKPGLNPMLKIESQDSEKLDTEALKNKSELLNKPSEVREVAEKDTASKIIDLLSEIKEPSIISEFIKEAEERIAAINKERGIHEKIDEHKKDKKQQLTMLKVKEFITNFSSKTKSKDEELKILQEIAIIIESILTKKKKESVVSSPSESLLESLRNVASASKEDKLFLANIAEIIKEKQGTSVVAPESVVKEYSEEEIKQPIQPKLSLEDVKTFVQGISPPSSQDDTKLLSEILSILEKLVLSDSPQLKDPSQILNENPPLSLKAVHDFISSLQTPKTEEDEKLIEDMFSSLKNLIPHKEVNKPTKPEDLIHLVDNIDPNYEDGQKLLINIAEIIKAKQGTSVVAPEPVVKESSEEEIKQPIQPMLSLEDVKTFVQGLSPPSSQDDAKPLSEILSTLEKLVLSDSPQLKDPSQTLNENPPLSLKAVHDFISSLQTPKTEEDEKLIEDMFSSLKNLIPHKEVNKPTKPEDLIHLVDNIDPNYEDGQKLLINIAEIIKAKQGTSVVAPEPVVKESSEEEIKQPIQPMLSLEDVKTFVQGLSPPSSQDDTKPLSEILSILEKLVLSDSPQLKDPSQTLNENPPLSLKAVHDFISSLQTPKTEEDEKLIEDMFSSLKNLIPHKEVNKPTKPEDLIHLVDNIDPNYEDGQKLLINIAEIIKAKQGTSVVAPEPVVKESSEEEIKQPIQPMLSLEDVKTFVQGLSPPSSQDDAKPLSEILSILEKLVLSDSPQLKDPSQTLNENPPLSLKAVHDFISSLQTPKTEEDEKLIEDMFSSLKNLIPHKEVNKPTKPEDLIHLVDNIDPNYEDGQKLLINIAEIIKAKQGTSVVAPEPVVKESSEEEIKQPIQPMLSLEDVKTFVQGLSPPSSQDDAKPLSEILSILEKLVLSDSPQLKDPSQTLNENPPLSLKAVHDFISSLQTPKTEEDEKLIEDMFSSLKNLIPHKEVNKPTKPEDLIHLVDNIDPNYEDGQKLLINIADIIKVKLPKHSRGSLSEHDNKISEEPKPITLENIRVFILELSRPNLSEDDLKICSDMNQHLDEILQKQSGKDIVVKEMSKPAEIDDVRQFLEGSGYNPDDSKAAVSEIIDILNKGSNGTSKLKKPSEPKLYESQTLEISLPQAAAFIMSSNSESDLRRLEDEIFTRLKSLKNKILGYDTDIEKLEKAINNIDDPKVLVGILNTLEERIIGMKKANLNEKRTEHILSQLDKIKEKPLLLKLLEEISSKCAKMGIKPSQLSEPDLEILSPENLERQIRGLSDHTLISKLLRILEEKNQKLQLRPVPILETSIMIPAQNTNIKDIESYLLQSEDLKELHHINTKVQERISQLGGEEPKKESSSLEVHALLEKESNPEALLNILEIIEKRVLKVNKKLPVRQTVAETEPIETHPHNQPNPPQDRESLKLAATSMLSNLDSTPQNLSLRQILEELVDILDNIEPSNRGNSDERAEKDADTAIARIKDPTVRLRLFEKLKKIVEQDGTLTNEIPNIQEAVEKLTDSSILQILHDIITKKLPSKTLDSSSSQMGTVKPSQDVSLSIDELESAIGIIQDQHSLKLLLTILENRVGKREENSQTDISFEDVKIFIEKKADPSQIQQIKKVIDSKLETQEKKSTPVEMIMIKEIRTIVKKLHSDKSKQDEFLNSLKDILKENQQPPVAVSPFKEENIDVGRILDFINSIEDPSILQQIITTTETKMIIRMKRPEKSQLKLSDIIFHFENLIMPTGKYRAELQSQLLQLLKVVFSGEAKLPNGLETVEKVLCLIKEMFLSDELSKYDRNISEQAQKVAKAIRDSSAKEAIVEFAKQRSELSTKVVSHLSKEPVSLDAYSKSENFKSRLDFDALSAISSEVITTTLNMNKNLGELATKHATAVKNLNEYLQVNHEKIEQKELAKHLNELIAIEGNLLGMRSIQLSGLNSMITLIKNPNIDKWCSFLSGLDLRLKAASEQLKIALGESSATGNNTKQLSSSEKESPTKQPGSKLSSNQEEELRNNITRLEKMINQISLLSKLSITPEELSRMQESIALSNADEKHDATVSGRIGTLVFNSTLIMLRIIDSVLLQLNAPESHRIELSRLLTESLRNTEQFGHARNRGSQNDMLHIVTQELTLQHRFEPMIHSWSLHSY